MLNFVQHAIARHEAMKRLSGGSGMSTEAFARDILSIAPKTYYEHLKKPEVALAVDEMVKKSEISSDFTKTVMNDVALEELFAMAKDKDIPPRERRQILSDLFKLTQYDADNVYSANYDQLSDEELFEIAVDRKSRLNMSDDEFTALLTEAQNNSH